MSFRGVCFSCPCGSLAGEMIRNGAQRDRSQRPKLCLLGWFLAVVVLWVTPNVSHAADNGVFWEDLRSSEGSLRRATFVVADAGCGYHVMAEPRTMGTLFRHVKKLVVHSINGDFQDVSIHERFFLVGNVESRYHRIVNGSDQIEWRLVAGRQARHDGTWVVEVREDGSAEVTFENLIKAKYAIHQGLLRRIQDRTMSDIVDSVRARCGVALEDEVARPASKSVERVENEPGLDEQAASTSASEAAEAVGAPSP